MSKTAKMLSVVALSTITLGAGKETKTVPPGTLIELPEADAQDALARGIVSQPGQYQAPATPIRRPETAEAVVAAIADRLRSWGDDEKANPENFTGSGKPSVAVLEKQLGYDITAEERDEAFAQVEKTLV